MEPENHPLEKEIPFWKPSFPGSMLKLLSVVISPLELFEIYKSLLKHTQTLFLFLPSTM